MLFIHAGLHKTASTTVQRFLERGLVGPRHNQTSRPWAYLGRAGLTGEGGFRTSSRAKKRLEAGRFHRADRPTVISYEGFLGRPLDMYSSAIGNAAKLANFFGESPFRLVVYLRPQHEWFESLYSHHIRGGGTQAPEEFVRPLLNFPFSRWSTLISGLKSVIGSDRLSVRIMEAERDSLSDFLEVIGIENQSAFRTRSRNVSPSALAMEALRRVNLESTSTREQWRSRRFVENNFSGRNSEYSLFPPDLQIALKTLVSEDWGNLSATVDGTAVSSSPESFAETGLRVQQSKCRPSLWPGDPRSMARTLEEASYLLARAAPTAFRAVNPIWKLFASGFPHHSRIEKLSDIWRRRPQ